MPDLADLKASAQDLKDAFNLVQIALAQLKRVDADSEQGDEYLNAAIGNLKIAVLRFQGE